MLWASLVYGLRYAARNLALILVFPTAGFAEPVTIAALGDSLTQGYGLKQEQGFVPQLENWLRQNGADVVVLNAGVSGDTTAGGLARIGWTLTDDVDAVIVALGGNDLLRGLDPALSKSNLDEILAQVTARDLPAMLVGLKAPGNYGTDYQKSFDAIYPELAEKYDAVLQEDFLAGLRVLDDPDATRQNYMQADAIHPNAEGVSLIVEALGPAVLQLVTRAKEKSASMN